MVKIGFICEGDTESIIINSVSFKSFLNSIQLELVKVVNATGNGNLLPKNIIPYTKILSDSGAEKIIILTDLDDDKCITATKQRIDPTNNYITIVSVRSIEAWFLADSQALSSLFRQNYFFAYPEAEVQPWETIRNLFKENLGRGVGSKPILAKKMIASGFDLKNASQHPDCKSAGYFIRRLKALAPALSE